MKAVYVTLMLAFFVSGNPVRAESMADQVQRRLDSVRTLIESSSAAKQIDSSRNANALAAREQARGLHKQAQAAFDSGDHEKAGKLLTQASQQMFSGVRLANPEEVNGRKKWRDYEAKLASARALLDAQKRVGVEKSDAEAGKTTAKVEAILADAERTSSRDIDKAIVLVNQAYLIAKASVGNMRGGETLVRSLNFATKEEEYHYEVDRNDTHQMLVKMLLDEKRESQGVDRMVQGFVDKATDLRKQAESKAGSRDFENAIKLLEDSTKELVRAIRGAGIYIPG